MKRGFWLATCLAAAALLGRPAQSQTPETAPAATPPVAAAPLAAAPVVVEPIDISKEQPAGDLNGALVIVRVPNLRGTLASFQSVVQKGMPGVPFDLVSIVGAKFQDPTLAGFPEGAGVAMIVTDSPTPDNVVVMAVAADQRAAYETQFKTNGLTTEIVGDLLVAAQMPQSLPAVRPLFANPAALMGENRTGIVADINAPAIIKQFGPAIEMQISEMAQSIAQAEAMRQTPPPTPATAPGATPAVTPAPTPAAPSGMAKMVEGEFRIIYNMAKQIESLRLTVDMQPAGLVLGKAVKPLPGTNLATWLGASHDASGPDPAQFLPGDGAIRIATKGVNMGAALDFCTAEFKAVAPQLGLMEADYGAFLAFMDEAKNIYGGNLAANMMIGGGSFLDSAWAMNVKDEAATLAFMESIPEKVKTSGMDKFYASMGQHFSVGFQKNAREYNGVAIHKFTEDFTFDDPNAAKAAASILGTNGHIEFEVAFVNGLLVQCSGTQKIEGLIDAVKAGKHPQTAPLKAEAVFVNAQGYIDFDLGAVIQKSMAAAMAGQQGGQAAMPMMMMANMFTGLPPLSMAWKTDGDIGKSTLLIPAELISRAGGTAAMFAGMNGAGGPGMGGQPPQSAPAPAPGTM